jgi:iron-sulfur cluster assembly protein
MSVLLTERAANHVKKTLERRGKGLGIKVGVKTAGCSGLAYQLEFVDESLVEDLSFNSHGVNVFVDQKSFPYVEGTQLDFVKEGLNEGFKFINPNVKGECGCGESFQV